MTRWIQAIWWGLLMTLVMLWVWGCAPIQWTHPETSAAARPPIRVCLFTPDPRGMLPAIDAWDTALGSWRHMTVSQSQCDVTVQEGVCEDKEALACADNLGGSVVTMVPGRYEGDPDGLLLHEIGHILGAQHLDGTLMQGRYSRHYACPDRETVAQVAAYQHVSLTLFSWCWR